MKKLLVLLSFVIAAAACATQPPANKEASANANKPAETKAAALSEADMISKEKATWETLQKKDYETFEKSLASDYLEVEDDGVYDKPGVLASVKDLNVTDVTYADWKTITIDPEAYLITYTVTVKGTVKGQDIPAGPYRAAAGWVNRDSKWVAIYFQQTPVQTEPPPPPAPAASAPAKAAESPAAKLGETGPDPIANEKLVWDAFRAKNFDGFGDMLAPEFMQIATTGVYDKSGSVKGISMMDASRYEQSDWRSVKFDNNAALVTYVVASAGPNAEKDRHTSIWANRDGKWRALLHVSTPAAKPEKK